MSEIKIELKPKNATIRCNGRGFKYAVLNIPKMFVEYLGWSGDTDVSIVADHEQMVIRKRELEGV